MAIENTELEITPPETEESDLELLTPEGEEENTEGEGNEEVDEEYELDETGEPKLDDEGNPIVKKAEAIEETPDEENLTRLSYKDLKEALKDKPELFKAAKTAFFREQKFTEIFPTVESAREAANTQQQFEQIRDVVISGNANDFLSELKSESPESVETFAKNFLPALAAVQEDTYYRVTGPVIQGVLAEVNKLAERESNTNLSNACKVLFKQIFGTTDIKVTGNAKETNEDPEARRLKAEKDEFFGKKYSDLRTSTWSEITTNLVSEIEKGIDPTNSLKPGLKKLLVEKVLADVTDAVAKDENHINKMNQYWEREKRVGFSGAYKDSIKTAYLSRAKALIPSIRQRIRQEALSGQRSSDDKLRNKVDSRQTRLEPGRNAGAGSSGRVTVREARKEGLSDLDILNGKRAK